MERLDWGHHGPRISIIPMSVMCYFTQDIDFEKVSKKFSQLPNLDIQQKTGEDEGTTETGGAGGDSGGPGDSNET